jgi:hypothetical protein
VGSFQTALIALTELWLKVSAMPSTRRAKREAEPHVKFEVKSSDDEGDDAGSLEDQTKHSGKKGRKKMKSGTGILKKEAPIVITASKEKSGAVGGLSSKQSGNGPAFVPNASQRVAGMFQSLMERVTVPLRSDEKGDDGAKMVSPERFVSKGVTEIAHLSLFKGSKIITARVVEKSDPKEWQSKDGKKSGVVLSLKLRDAKGDTIQGTFFDGTEEFYEGIEVGKAYTFYGGELKMANPQYNTCSSNLEFTFKSKGRIELALNFEDDAISSTGMEEKVPTFVSIATLEMFKRNQGIRGMVMKKNPLRTYTNLKGPGCVFSVDLEDNSDKTIRATFFNEEAKTFYEFLAEGNTYTFVGFAISRSVHQYDDCTSPFELRMERGCEINAYLFDDDESDDDA